MSHIISDDWVSFVFLFGRTDESQYANGLQLFGATSGELSLTGVVVQLWGKASPQRDLLVGT